MIHIVKGDLLKSDCDIIVHQSNSFAKLGAGIAKQIVHKYPQVEIVDRLYHIPVGSKARLGNYSVYLAPDGVRVVNMYSQYKWGRGKQQTDYKAMEEALYTILKDVKGKKLGMPYLIGCGLAGGDWKEVYALIDKLSHELNRDVYLYKL